MNFQDTNVFITGITGFVGSYLADYLLKQGANVYGLNRRESGGKAPAKLVEAGVHEDTELIEGDLTDISSLANAIEKSEPSHIFHLAAQSYVPYSFTNPLDVMNVNAIGTINLLEAVRLSQFDPPIVFAGSSEEYGLVITSKKQYKRVLEKREHIFPKPKEIPEIPIKETNPLRPMSPYGVSKVFGDHIMRNYFHSYGLRTKVSRAFNHEGARRGEEFVTSIITKQVMKLKYEEKDKIEIGNVNAFRDWSHVNDIVKGYCIISSEGKEGDVYNQGSMRVNSVLTYILLSLEEAGYNIDRIKTIKNNKKIEDPNSKNKSKAFGAKFMSTKVDEMFLNDEIVFEKEDKGLIVETEKEDIKIKFKQDRFRPAEVPILLCDNNKIKDLGFKSSYNLTDIIKDQLKHYMKPERRNP